MSRQRRSSVRSAVAVGVLVPLLALAGCSAAEDDAPNSDSSAATSTGVPGSGAAATGEADGSAAGSAGAGSPSEGSGNPGQETFVNGPATVDKTVTFGTDATLAPSELEVEPGEVVTFTAVPDAPAAAITFNGTDTYPISNAQPMSFVLSEPGTYTVSEDVSGATMTITVTT